MQPVKYDNGLYRKFWTNNAGQPYSDGFHCGKDYGCDEGSEVYAVCDGEIALAGQYMGYGSLNPATYGGCVWIKHTTSDGKVFYGTYGHLTIDPNILNGSKTLISMGDVIGRVAHFTNAGTVLPHCHFGIWNSSEPFPNNHWGYTPVNNKLFWENPVQFLIDNNIA
jgi:murein DD-endopeptidase MepM/ murein hydrolase activator NlpD